MLLRCCCCCFNAVRFLISQLIIFASHLINMKINIHKCTYVFNNILVNRSPSPFTYIRTLVEHAQLENFLRALLFTKTKNSPDFLFFFFLCSLFVWLSVTCQLVIFDGPLLYFMYVHTYIHTAECWCVYGFWLAVYAELVKYLNILICIISNKAFRCCFYLVFKNGCELYFHKCSLGGKWVCQNF